MKQRSTILINSRKFSKRRNVIQFENEFLEKLTDGKEIGCVDIQNESHKDKENTSNDKNLMIIGTKNS